MEIETTLGTLNPEQATPGVNSYPAPAEAGRPAPGSGPSPLERIPLGLDEELTFELPGQDQVPKAKRRRVKTRPLRRRQTRRLRELVGWLKGVKEVEARASESLALQVFAAADEMAAVLEAVLIGWDNMTDEKGRAVAFDPGRLDDVMDDGDIMAVAGLLGYQGSLGVQEKKASGSPLPLNTPGTAGSRPSTASLLKGPLSGPSGSFVPGVMGDGRDGSVG